MTSGLCDSIKQAAIYWTSVPHRQNVSGLVGMPPGPPWISHCNPYESHCIIATDTAENRWWKPWTGQHAKPVKRKRVSVDYIHTKQEPSQLTFRIDYLPTPRGPRKTNTRHFHIRYDHSQNVRDTRRCRSSHEQYQSGTLCTTKWYVR